MTPPALDLPIVTAAKHCRFRWRGYRRGSSCPIREASPGSLVDDVVAVEDGAALVAGQEHGDPLGLLTVAPERPRPGHLYACRLSQSGYAGRAHLFIVGLEEGRVFAGSTEDPVLLDEERARISEDLTRSTDRIDEAVYGVLSRLAVSGAHATFSYACRPAP